MGGIEISMDGITDAGCQKLMRVPDDWREVDSFLVNNDSDDGLTIIHKNLNEINMDAELKRKYDEAVQEDINTTELLGIVAESANEAINKRGCEVKSKYDYSNLENNVRDYLEDMKYRYPTWLEMTISYLCYDDTLHVIFNYKNPLLFLCKSLDRDPDNPDILTKVITGGLSNKSEFILYRNICKFIDDYIDEVKFFIHGTFTRKPMGFIHGKHPSDCGLNYDVVIKHYDELLKNNTEFIEVTSWIQIISDFPRREFKLHKRTQRSFLPYNELSIMNTKGPLEYYNYVAPFK